jgi:hypothetical protein
MENIYVLMVIFYSLSLVQMVLNIKYLAPSISVMKEFYKQSVPGRLMVIESVCRANKTEGMEAKIQIEKRAEFFQKSDKRHWFITKFSIAITLLVSIYLILMFIMKELGWLLQMNEKKELLLTVGIITQTLLIAIEAAYYVIMRKDIVK